MIFGVFGGHFSPKTASLATTFSRRENLRKRLCLREIGRKKESGLTAIAIRPRDKLPGGVDEIRTHDPYVANVML